METTNDKCGEIGSMVDTNNIKWWNENPAVDIKLKTGYESIGNRQHSRTLIITDDHYQVNIKQLHLNSHISVIFELSQHWEQTDINIVHEVS